MRLLLINLRIALLKRRARRLYLANAVELSNKTCGFHMADYLSGGRLSRREAQIKELYEEGQRLEEVKRALRGETHPELGD